LPKQYTFKTTRQTSWMDSILEAVDSRDRSSFIRDMIELGMRATNIQGVPPLKTYTGVTNVLPLCDKCVTNEPQMSDNCVTNVTHEAPVPDDEVIFEEKEIDFESILDSMYK
jgi:hypothetical protein